MFQTEFGPEDHSREFEKAMEAFDNNQRAKAGLPPIKKAMGFVDSPDFSGQLPIDDIEDGNIPSFGIIEVKQHHG